MKGILTSKPGSIYNDIRDRQYHFPGTYLKAMNQIVGDLFVYYEPKRPAGRQAYIALGKLREIVPDDNKENHFFGYVEDYLDFERQVAQVVDGCVLESGLDQGGGKINRGRIQRSVRPISDFDFYNILDLGFVDEDEPWESTNQTDISGFEESSLPFGRPIIEQILHRPFRDRSFSRQVRAAYHSRCAITRLKIKNGLGRPEVEAAHIRPVSEGGTDSIRNGIALSRTFHWMFDRGLMSLENDFSIRFSRQLNDQSVVSLVNDSGKALVPENQTFQPHPEYLGYHRQNIFKG